MALRLGAEWTISPLWAIGGGLAFEPSPVPDGTIEPGFPQGDATVFALGASYNLPALSFDAGYSYHQYDTRKAFLARLRFPLPRHFQQPVPGLLHLGPLAPVGASGGFEI